MARLTTLTQLLESKTMTIQLIGKDDSSFDDSEVLTGRWQSYIESFVSVGLVFSSVSSKLTIFYLRVKQPKAYHLLKSEFLICGGVINISSLFGMLRTV